MNHFLELGISVSNFADIISSQPEILDCGLNSSVCPTIEALREAVGSNENMVPSHQEIQTEIFVGSF